MRVVDRGRGGEDEGEQEKEGRGVGEGRHGWGLSGNVGDGPVSGNARGGVGRGWGG